MNESYTESKTSDIESSFGSVYFKDGKAYVVTHDGECAAESPIEMAKLIALGLRAQEKVYSGKYPNLEKLMRLLNCRKTVLAAAGSIDVKSAVDGTNDDVNGLEMLFSDVQRLQKEGFEPAVVDSDYVQFSEHLDAYTGEFPCIVHIFETDMGSRTEMQVYDSLSKGGVLPQNVLEGLHRIHSFLVIGKDKNEYVCFQNMGPDLDDPISVVNLDQTLFPYESEDPNRVGIIFFGPAK